jgi:hypothetical protein
MKSVRSSLRGWVVFLAFLVASALPGYCAIELSAALQEFNGEGIIYRRLVFKDNDRIIFYQPPTGWSCRKIDNYLALAPPDKKFAEAQISATPIEQPPALNEQTVAQAGQSVLGTLPPASQDGKITKQDIDPLLLHGSPAIEINASYQALGETFRRTVITVYTPKQQIVFKLSARTADFEPLYRAFRASINSWEWQPQ